MNPTIQSGMHPDAESLTAFAEQLLPAAEREQILAHMSTCSRCREVVFLGQSSIEAEMKPIPASAGMHKEPRRSWFKDWRWAWVPAAAFAGLIGVAVVQHFRQVATDTQMTAKLSPTDALGNAEPAKAPAIAQSRADTAKAAPANPQPMPPPAPKLKQEMAAKPAEVRDGALLRDEKDARQLDRKKSVEQKEIADEAAGASPVSMSPGLAGGSLHGTLAARAKSSAVGGPMAANQFQQQNMAAQNALQQTQNAQMYTANKPAILSAPTVRSSTETVEVQPQSAPAPVSLTPPVQLPTVPLADQSFDFSSSNAARLSKTAKITLPSGLEDLSVATQAGRSVALDTAGALFLSEDGGKHWKPVQMQWTGRAVLVRTRPVGTQTDALQAARPMRFELVNDKLQTWVSFDGKTWTAQPLPLQ